MTPRPARRQKEHRRSKSTLDESFLTPRPTRRQKEHRRDGNKANQLKIFDTKAHKKTEKAQKRQQQSKPT